MFFRVGDFQLENKVIEELSRESLSQLLPMSAIRTVLTETKKTETRNRRLPMEIVAALLILMNLFPHESISKTLKRLFHLVRVIE